MRPERWWRWASREAFVFIAKQTNKHPDGAAEKKECDHHFFFLFWGFFFLPLKLFPVVKVNWGSAEICLCAKDSPFQALSWPYLFFLRVFLETSLSTSLWASSLSGIFILFIFFVLSGPPLSFSLAIWIVWYLGNLVAPMLESPSLVKSIFRLLRPQSDPQNSFVSSN